MWSEGIILDSLMLLPDKLTATILHSVKFVDATYTIQLYSSKHLAKLKEAVNDTTQMQDCPQKRQSYGIGWSAEGQSRVWANPCIASLAFITNWSQGKGFHRLHLTA